MARTKYLDLADRIEEGIRKDPSFILPTLLDISRLHGVSYVTAWKAFRELARRGVVLAGDGRKCTIHPRIRPESSSQTGSSYERLTQTLMARIENGVYQFGKPLPKVDFIVGTEQCARITVLQACRRLSEEGLIHKVRNRWIAGPAPRRSSRQAFRPGGCEVVGALVNRPEEWTGEVIGNTFVLRFTGPLLDELSARSFQVVPLARHPSSQNRFLSLPSGRKECEEAIRRLGDRYRGTFIWCTHLELEGMEEWISWLGTLRKPVVFLDHADRGASLTRARVGIGKQYCRMHMDETAAIRMTLGALRDAGHTSIGLHNITMLDWAMRRNESIRACVRDEFPALTVSLSEPVEECWTIRDWFGMHDMLLYCAQKAGVELFDSDGEFSDSVRLRKVVAANSTSLIDLISRHGVTALIACNDRIAREYFAWCKYLGIAVPADLSIVSFDNEQASVCFPISTVDFGCARLGYLAAHMVIGDINAHADRTGSIAGVCSLVDRGSIGKPGRPGIALKGLRT